jgi:hypothetical protein
MAAATAGAKAIDWKARARLLERKVMEQDNEIAELKGDDVASEDKL